MDGCRALLYGIVEGSLSKHIVGYGLPFGALVFAVDLRDPARRRALEADLGVRPPDSVFAFPQEPKELLTDASHVRNAIARFDQVTGVSDEERELAFANIEKAAAYYGVNMSETSWKDLGSHPH